MTVPSRSVRSLLRQWNEAKKALQDFLDTQAAKQTVSDELWILITTKHKDTIDSIKDDLKKHIAHDRAIGVIGHQMV